MNDGTSPKCKLQAVRDALREELDATNTYETLKALDPDHAEIYDEIKKDEVNHSGRLLNIILTMDPDEVEPINKGLEQEEPDANQ